MLQYVHWHDVIGEGFSDKYSKAVTQQDGDAFEFLRSFERGGEICTSYVSSGNMGYLMQRQAAPQVFNRALGINLNEMNAYVAEYIGQLEMSWREKEDKPDASGNLPDGKLPRPGAFGLQLANGLKPVFAQAVEILLYTDKVLVLTGSTSAEMTKYLKSVLALFPAQYANRIGFVACPFSWDVLIGDISDLAKNIRIVTLESHIEDTSIYGERFAFLDVNAPAPLDRELSPYSRAIQSVTQYLIAGQGMRVNALLRAVCPCFGQDGSVNFDQLALALKLYEFDTNRCAETATILLQAKETDTYGVIASYKIVDAVNELYAQGAPDAETEKLILTARQDPEVEQYVKPICGKFAFDRISRGQKVSESAYEDAIEYFSEQEPDVLCAQSELLSPWFASHHRSLRVFEFLCRAYSRNKAEEILKLIYEYLNVQQVFNQAPQAGGHTFDQELFDVITKHATDKIDLIGAMMLSCYVSSTVGQESERKKRTLRMNALVTHINNTYATAGERLMYSVELKAAVERVADICFEDVRGADDFAFLPEESLNEMVGEMTFAEVLELVLKQERALNNYSVLHGALIGRLASLTEVQDNVQEPMIYYQYLEFFNNGSRNLQGYDVEGITQHLDTQEQMYNIDDSILEYRRSYVKGCYDIMTDEQKKRLTRLAIKNGADKATLETPEAVYETLNSKIGSNGEQKKQLTKLAEAVVIQHLENSKTNRMGRMNPNITYFWFALACGVACAVLAAILILAIPVTISTVLEFDFAATVDRIFDFWSVHHSLIVLATLVVPVIAYVIHWRQSHRDRKTAIKKEILIGALTCVAPVLVYAIMYILTYMVL